MTIDTIYLWSDQSPTEMEKPKMTVYIPQRRISDCALVIFPGGGYRFRAEHEGKDYAEFFAQKGITAAVVDYRIYPQRFPAPLQDAQRAIQILRYCAWKYGIHKDKIAVMGSSAGGHLAALVSTYGKSVCSCKDAISQEKISPDAQILCYPVINLIDERIAHTGSGNCLLGERLGELGGELSPDLIADAKSPPAFIWHTLEDGTVNVMNSLRYVKRLKEQGVKAELHLFPDGEHGQGLALGASKCHTHNRKWTGLLLEWLTYIGFIE